MEMGPPQTIIISQFTFSHGPTHTKSQLTYDINQVKILLSAIQQNTDLILIICSLFLFLSLSFSLPLSLSLRYSRHRDRLDLLAPHPRGQEHHCSTSRYYKQGPFGHADKGIVSLLYTVQSCLDAFSL